MDRKNHWEAIYNNKSPLEVSWYQEKPIISLELINKYSEKKTDQIIDVGGGSSTLSDYLLENEFKNLSVLDLSSNAIEHAKRRLADKSDLIKWVVADVTSFVPTNTYDLWHDRAVFHFLTDINDRKKYKQTLASSVKPGGKVIMAAFAIGGPTQCSGLDIVQYDAAKLKEELGDNFILLDERHESHITPDGKEQAFGYYVFAREMLKA